MQLNLPYKFDNQSMNISALELPDYPYIVSTSGAKIMTKEEIILRLESAIDNKDTGSVIVFNWNLFDMFLNNVTK